jgi:uncharacterized protein (TIGR00730 family)
MEDIEKTISAHNGNGLRFRPKKMTLDDIRNGCISLYGPNNTESEICVINEELRQAIDTVRALPEKSITVFGSARTPESDPYYQQAVRISERAGRAGFITITGGGPGIMEAANRGAKNANIESVGMTIKLPMEQVTSLYVTNEIPFYFFFTRKTAMRYGARVFLFFPGGFGTLDELMESLTLKQTHKIDPVPFILVGKEFWGPLDTFIREQLVTRELIDPNDPELYTITDDEDEIMRIILEAPERSASDR